MSGMILKKNLGVVKFTLIEILLVCATIMLLISVLLPSLARSKGYAREVACMSNLRQIALAYRGYFTDNNDLQSLGALLAPGAFQCGFHLRTGIAANQDDADQRHIGMVAERR